MSEKGTKLDCADLALTLLVGYASENGLPLQLSSADGKVAFDSNSDKYNSVGEFKKDALTLGSQDISSNTFGLNRDSKQAGDMSILVKPAGHIVVHNGGTGSGITYGNLRGGKASAVESFSYDWTQKDYPGYEYLKDRKTVYRWKVLKQ